MVGPIGHVASVTVLKEGLLMVEASRDPALLPRERAVDVLLETNETEDEPKPFTRDEPADTKLE